MARTIRVVSPSPTPVVVVGRYGGTVGVLADILTGAGIAVGATASLDGGGPVAVRHALADGAASVVVVTVAPADAALDLVLAVVAADRVVGVTWHPADERPPVPDAVTVVAAGGIHRDLAAAVRARR